jgi:hypothetical protein
VEGHGRDREGDHHCFATVMPSGSGFAEEYLQGGYNVTATNGTITTIEQVYLP